MDYISKHVYIKNQDFKSSPVSDTILMTNDLLRSGVAGLDTLLNGGYLSGRMYLAHGSPGTGKTMLGMHFLEAGLEDDETVLFVHGEESRSEIMASASAVDIDISDAEFLDLGPESNFFTESQSYDLVDPGEIERDRFTREIHTTIEAIDPDRIVVDPISQLRYVQPNSSQFRREILSFMRFLKQQAITVLATTTPSPDSEYENQLQSLSDGIVDLSYRNGERRIEVSKHRTVGQLGSDHGMEIRDGGVEVFPSLVPERHVQSIDDTQLSTGIDELDELLGGGLERNTVTFVSGPTGTGKTTIGSQILSEAGDTGNVAVYLFEESVQTFTHRSEALGIPVTELREAGRLSLTAVEPLAYSAEEFAGMVRRDVSERDVTTVMIDGIDGYTMALQGDKGTLVPKLHSLSRFLTNEGVTVLVTDEISEVTGVSSATSVNASYIADNIIVLSYVEVDSNLRKVIGVLKKRAGAFEHTLREFELVDGEIRVSDPLTGVTGILQGAPRKTAETMER